MSGRVSNLTCRARCRRRRRSRRHGPSLGWSRGAATAPGPAPSSTERTGSSDGVSRPLTRTFEFLFGGISSRFRSVVIQSWSAFYSMDETGEMTQETTVFQNPSPKITRSAFLVNTVSNAPGSPSFHGAEVVPPFKQVSIVTRPTSPPSLIRRSRARDPRIGVWRAFPSPPPTNISTRLSQRSERAAS